MSVQSPPGLLGHLLSARSTARVDAIMGDLPIVSPDDYQWISADERSSPWKPGHLHWIPVGADRGNGGRIKLAGEPMNPLAERLVNGMESLIELARLKELEGNPAAVMPNIGVFGQGGSSAFSVSEYSIVVTRRAADIRGKDDGGAGWSIVRAIQPKGRRDLYYAYLAASEDGAVPRVEAAEADKAGFLNGAQFTHIKYDFGTADSAIARLMYPALNHVLFNPVMPYDLYALKDTPEPMLGTAQRLARRVRLISQSVGRQAALDKAFASQPVG